MKHKAMLGPRAILSITVLLLGPVRVASADEAPNAGDRIVPPSGYVESIETPGTTGGTENEADAAKAQAEAAKAATPPTTADSGQHAAAIATNLIIARPTALMATVAGSAFFALSLPITLPTGQYDQALERFVTAIG
jgi:hypothetical protein